MKHRLRNVLFAGRLMFGAMCVAVVGAAMAGCGGSGGDGGSGKKVTVVLGDRFDPFFLSMQCGAEAAGKRLGVDLSIQASQEYSPAQQIPLIEAAMAQSPAGLSVAPTDTAALEAPLRKAKEEGASITLLDTSINDADEIASSVVTENFVPVGEKLAEGIAKQVSEKGKVLLIGGEPTSTTQIRAREGFERAIKKYPNIEYLGIQYDQSDSSKTATIVSGFLARNPELAGIVTIDGPSAPGVINVLKREGKFGTVKWVSGDGTPELVEALKAGEVAELVVLKPYVVGELGVKYAVEASEGKKVPQNVETEPVVATKENVDSPEVAKYLYHGC